jgi:thiosulfate dehydrogenase [quinone] large subunit
MNKISFLLFRVGIAMSLLGHGIARLPKLEAFSVWMSANFKTSFLPKELVVSFSYLLPFAEFTLGLLLLIGLFTKPAAAAAAVLMIILVFGASVSENWEAIPSQLIHLAFFTVVLQFIKSNCWAMDELRKNRR